MHDEIDDADPYETKRGAWENIGEDTRDFSLDFTGEDQSDKGVLTSNFNSQAHDQPNPYKYALNLLPQSKEEWPITLTIAVVNISNEKYPSGNPKNEYEFSGDIKIPVTTAIDWKQGNRYTYKFRFERDWTPENINAVKLEVTVDDFVNNIVEYDYAGDQTKAVPMRYAGSDENGSWTDLYVAQCNLGANYPYESGLYFYYGDTEGHKLVDGKFDNGFKFGLLTEDGTMICQGKTVADLISDSVVEGIGDKKDDGTYPSYKLTNKYDAAQVKLGTKYHVPTNADFEWLFNTDNVTREVKIMNGVKVWKMTSISTGKTIYLPAAGWATGGWNYNDSGSWMEVSGNELQTESMHYFGPGNDICYRTSISKDGIHRTDPIYPENSFSSQVTNALQTYAVLFQASMINNNWSPTSTSYLVTLGGMPIRAVAYEDPEANSTPTPGGSDEGE